MSEDSLADKAVRMMMRRGMSSFQCADFCRVEYGRNCLQLSHKDADHLYERVSKWPGAAHAHVIEEQKKLGQTVLPGL